MHHHQLMHTDITNKGLIGLHSLFKVVGSSFVAIFIPAILYTEFGFSIGQVFLFTAVHSMTAFALQYWVSSGFIARQWTKPSMMIGVVFFILYMLVLAAGSWYSWIILLSPLLSGAHTAFFWMGYHVALSTDTEDKDLGKKIAWLEMVGVVAAMMGPVVGWILTDVFGTSVLFIVAAVCILISLIPLWLDDHAHTRVERSPSRDRTKQKLSLKESISAYLPMVAPFSGLGYLQFVWAVVWSILLYVHFESFTKVGMISSATSIIVLGAVWSMGKSSDEKKWHDHNLMKWAVRIQATTRWLMALALITSFFSNVVFMVADAFHKVAYRLSTTYLNKQMYTHHMNTGEEPIVVALKKALMYEWGIHCFRAIMCVLLSIVSIFMTDKLFFFAVPLMLVLVIVPLELLFPKDVKSIND